MQEWITVFKFQYFIFDKKKSAPVINKAMNRWFISINIHALRTPMWSRDNKSKIVENLKSSQSCYLILFFVKLEKSAMVLESF